VAKLWLECSPRLPSHNWVVPTSKEGGKGRGKGKEGDGKEERKKGRRGKGGKGKDDLHPTLFLGPAILCLQ